MKSEIKKIIEEIHPLRRMINSEGMDMAFSIVKKYLPDLKIHEYKVGEMADDWEVPYGWELLSAEIKKTNGELIASNLDSHLIVAAYSEPVNGIFTKEEISKHLRCHPTLDDAFFMEHRNAYNYNLVDWGITLPKSLWNHMNEDVYEVNISVRRDYNRSMKVGEFIINGKSDHIISFTAHIDELCNDNLSSCAVLIEYFSNLYNNKNFKPYYSYQLLLVPEIIGSFFYVKNNHDKILKTKSMINLETVGRGKDWLIKQSLKTNNYIDRLMEITSKHILKDYITSDIFDGYGNEERVFEYPTIGIPSVALQRYPFEEYHSSYDTPDLLLDINLHTAYDFVEYLVEIIEKDFIPEYSLLLPPWLTKHGLYFDSKDEPELFNLFMNQIQFNINGENSLIDLCCKYKIPFHSLHEYILKFVEKKFILKKHTDELWKN